MRIGIDLGGTKIEGILLAEDGALLQKIRVDTPAENYESTLDALHGVITQLQGESGGGHTVGIGTPGTLSKDTGVMKNCNSTCLNGQPFHKDIEARLGYEIRMENDANCFALSEAVLGAGKTAKSVFGVILGTGTGGGVVIDGKLLSGPNSIAGEWGHNPIPVPVRNLVDGARVCYCGRTNCIETVLSGRGLSETYLEQTAQELTAAEIAELAQEEDQSALDCLQIYYQQLGICLATVVNIIDPEVIVLGGGLSNISSLYEEVPKYLAQNVFTDVMHTKLLPPSFGDASGARGAACLWPAS